MLFKKSYILLTNPSQGDVLALASLTSESFDLKMCRLMQYYHQIKNICE